MKIVAMKRRMHGLSKTPEYLAWKAMKWRCNEKNKANRKYYFDKGIGVFQEWADSFPLFRAYIGFMPHEGMEVDRIDGSKGYHPGNVRWANRTQQMRNREGNCLVTINDETLTVAEWAERSGIPETTVRYRVHRGWPTDQIISTEFGRHRVGRCA